MIKKDPNACVLSTISSSLEPSSRVVLLKDFSKSGFVFFTNYVSKKGQDISFNNNVDNYLFKYFKNMKQYMHPSGRLVIVDFKIGDLPVGPPDEHKLTPETVIRELERVGYRQISHALELPYQYVLVFDLEN